LGKRRLKGTRGCKGPCQIRKKTWIPRNHTKNLPCIGGVRGAKGKKDHKCANPGGVCQGGEMAINKREWLDEFCKVQGRKDQGRETTHLGPLKVDGGGG